MTRDEHGYMVIDTTELGQVLLQCQAYRTKKILTMSYELVILYPRTHIGCENILLSSWIVSVLSPGILSLPVGQRRTDSSLMNTLVIEVHSHNQAVHILDLESLKHHLPKRHY